MQRDHETPGRAQRSGNEASAGGSDRRGRDAESPGEVPRQGWWDILWRTVRSVGEDNLTVVAAGVAFYAFLAVVPALAATIALYALFSDAEQIARHLEYLTQVVPEEVMPILREQITRIVQNERAAGFSAIIGLVLALYGSAKATKAMIAGLNIAYGEREKRNFLRLNFAAVMMTLGGIIGVIVIIALVAVLPAVLRVVGLSDATGLLLSLLRWPLLIALFVGALAVIYRFGPCRNEPRWRWLSGGAILAAVLWVLGSAGFSYYVSQFGNYDKTYGSLGAIVVFLLWLLVSAFVILLGAELNAEMERQTARDTTVGEPEPLGERGAHAADTVGPSRSAPARREQASPSGSSSAG